MNQFCCTTTIKVVRDYAFVCLFLQFKLLLTIETKEGVVELLEPPVSEEATPLPSSHDVLAQNVRLQKAVNRLGLVTQQVWLYCMSLLCYLTAVHGLILKAHFTIVFFLSL